MTTSLSLWSYRLHCRWKRLCRAFDYATAQLSQNDAQTLIMDCQPLAGWYPLMVLTEDDVFEMAADLHGDAADALAPYIPGACDYVGRKWEASGDDYWHARHWALEIAQEWVAQEGVAVLSTPSLPNSQKGTCHG
ncbi:MAG: hypothetical protein PHW76_06400 [Alphaproteobacteria bacterium]|nr:hypothetical protein [Alphaproteobacteria bacterium]